MATRLERLLADQDQLFRRYARHYARRSWGSSVFSFDDYLQEAQLVACDIYQRHIRRDHEKKTDDELGQLINNGVLYRLRRLWRNEIKKVLCGTAQKFCPVCSRKVKETCERQKCQKLMVKKGLKILVDQAQVISADVVPIPYVAEIFFTHVLQESMALLTELQREMLTVLLTPEQDPLGWMLCYYLFKSYPHLPLQRAEFWYLAQHFQMSEAEVKVHFFDMRDKLRPVLLGDAA